MAEVASAYVSILPSAKGFGSKLERDVGGEVNGVGSKLGKSFGTLFKVGAVAAIGGAVILGKFLKGAVEEAREAQVITARTQNVITSMGNAANISASQVAKLAEKISLKTGVDDEAIQSGQNLLLTFGNIRNEVGKGNDIFNRTTGLMVDLSAAMGTDAKGSAIQLGKALNDPVKGITALTRVGVSFTQQQKDQIAAMVESGDTLGAQKVILKELERQFGGAAEAMATPADRARVAWGNFKEQIGTALLPVVDRLLTSFVTALPKIQSALAGLRPTFEAIGSFVIDLGAKIAGVFSGGGGGGILAGFQSLIPVVQQAAATFTGTILPAVTSFVTYVSTALGPVFAQIGAIITGQVLPILVSFGTFVYGTLYPAIVSIVTAIGQQLKPVFDQLVATFKSSVLPAIQQLLAKFQEYQPTIQKVIGVIVLVIGKVLEFAAAILGRVLPPVIRFAGFLISNVVPAVIGFIGVIVKIIAKAIEFGQVIVDRIKDVAKFVAGLKEKFNNAVQFVQDIPGKILDALGNLGELLVDAGKDLIQGLINGITSKFEDVKGALGGLTDNLTSWKGPPSKDAILLRPAGRAIIGGLIDGFKDAIPDVEATLKGITERIADSVKSKLDELKSDFTSLRDSIAGAFTGDLFSAETAATFLSGLLDTRGQLRQLKAAFKKLLGWGINPQFLSQLFASGNGGLILDLAGDQATATQSAGLFNQIGTLSGQLGTSVARADIGPKIDKTNEKLDQLIRIASRQGREFSDGINTAASNGMRGRAA